MDFVTHRKREFEWLSKAQMITRFGQEKALAKIQFGKLPHRPGEDTGLDGEWGREYKIYADTGGDTERNKRKEGMTAEEELNDPADVAAAKESLDSMASCVAGNTSADSTSASSSSKMSETAASGAEAGRATIKGEPRDTTTTTSSSAGGTFSAVLQAGGTFSKMKHDMKKGFATWER